jgi:hypothetical protein
MCNIPLAFARLAFLVKNKEYLVVIVGLVEVVVGEFFTSLLLELVGVLGGVAWMLDH